MDVLIATPHRRADRDRRPSVGRSTPSLSNTLYPQPGPLQKRNVARSLLSIACYLHLCCTLSINNLSRRSLTTAALECFHRTIMSEFPTPIAPLAPQPTGDASGAESSQQEAPPPAPITDQEVGEYREQDRYLPVCSSTRFIAFAHLTYL